MVMEALDEIGCGTDEGRGCMDELDLEEYSGAGAAGGGNTTANIRGYIIPMGMRPPGPRRDITKVARRSFGGIEKKRGKR